jgi:hypothetical protein
MHKVTSNLLLWFLFLHVKYRNCSGQGGFYQQLDLNELLFPMISWWPLAPIVAEMDSAAYLLS